MVSATPVCKVTVHISISERLQNREFPVYIVASNSRRASIKSTAIPRSELLGNVLLSRLMTSVKNALSKVINPFHATDLF